MIVVINYTNKQMYQLPRSGEVVTQSKHMG